MPVAQPTSTEASAGNAANAECNARTDTSDGAREPENPIVDDSSKSNIETLSEMKTKAPIFAVKSKALMDAAAQQCYTDHIVHFVFPTKSDPAASPA
jgi:hypothetical protein